MVTPGAGSWTTVSPSTRTVKRRLARLAGVALAVARCRFVGAGAGVDTGDCAEAGQDGVELLERLGRRHRGLTIGIAGQPCEAEVGSDDERRGEPFDRAPAVRRDTVTEHARRIGDHVVGRSCVGVGLGDRIRLGGASGDVAMPGAAWCPSLRKPTAATSILAKSTTASRASELSMT